MSNSNNKDETGAEVLSHNYDGIQELNNPLPGWWLTTFYITIVFSIGYYGYYEMFGGPSSDQYLAADMNDIDQRKAKVVEKVAAQSELSLEEMLANTEMLAKGKGHFASKCAACHGQLGEGGIGPNLTDRFWISSQGNMDGVLEAIREGFPAKGMPPWQDLVPPGEQPYLAAFVLSLKDTNPPNGKAPQGAEVK